MVMAQQPYLVCMATKLFLSTQINPHSKKYSYNFMIKEWFTKKFHDQVIVKMVSKKSTIYPTEYLEGWEMVSNHSSPTKNGWNPLVTGK